MKKGSNSKKEEDGRFRERREDHGRASYSRSSIRTHRHHSSPYSEINFYASEDPINSPAVSPVRHQRRRHEVDSLQGELRKLNPPSLMVREKGKMMLKHGCLDSRGIFNFITIHQTWKPGFPSTIYKG
jgi:hypothetical protein